MTGRLDDPDERRDIAVGALLGTFVGDALGRPWEGTPPAAGRDAGDRLTWLDHERVLAYTDDTQLTLALADHLVEHPDVDPDAWVATILEVFEDHRGYGAGMRQLVTLWRSGTPWQQAATAVFPDGSFGNGAAMRVAPVGIRFPDEPERREEAARAQGMVTHAHPVGLDGAVVQAAAVARAAVAGRFTGEDVAAVAASARTAQLREPVEQAAELVGRWHDGHLDFGQAAALLGTDVVVDRSLPAALFCAAAADDVAGAVGLALGLGGDADTVAAMAGAVRGAADGRGAIPDRWLLRLEDGARGVSHAVAVAERLASDRG